jgi:hypothetical protein
MRKVLVVAALVALVGPSAAMFQVPLWHPPMLDPGDGPGPAHPQDPGDGPVIAPDKQPAVDGNALRNLLGSNLSPEEWNAKRLWAWLEQGF